MKGNDMSFVVLIADADRPIGRWRLMYRSSRLSSRLHYVLGGRKPE